MFLRRICESFVNKIYNEYRTIIRGAGEIIEKVSFYRDELPPFSQASFKYPINSASHSKSSHTCEGMSAAPVGWTHIFKAAPPKSVPERLRIGPVLGRLKCLAMEHFIENGFSRWNWILDAGTVNVKPSACD